MQAGRPDEAQTAFDRAISLLEESGDRRGAARVEARRADLLRFEGRVEEALASMQSAYDELVGGDHDADLALVASMLARVSYFAGKIEAAAEPVELALEIAEALRLPEALAEALNTKAMLLFRRPHESEALLYESLKVAQAHDLTEAVLRAQFNLSGLAIEHDRFQEARGFLEDSLAWARRRGDRAAETYTLSQLAEVLVELGEWNRALALLLEAPSEGQWHFAAASSLLARLPVFVARGELDQARAMFTGLVSLQDSSDRQDIATYLLCESILCRAEGKLREAVEAGQSARQLWYRLAQYHYGTRSLVETGEAFFELDDLAAAERLLQDSEQLPAILRRPLLEAQLARLRAKLRARSGDPAAGQGYVDAAKAFAELEFPYWLAVTFLEYGVAGRGRAQRRRSADARGSPGDLRAAGGSPVDRASRQPERRAGANRRRARAALSRGGAGAAGPGRGAETGDRGFRPAAGDRRSAGRPDGVPERRSARQSLRLITGIGSGSRRSSLVGTIAVPMAKNSITWEPQPCERSWSCTPTMPSA